MTPESQELYQLTRLTNEKLAGKGLKSPLLDDVYGDPPWIVAPPDAIHFYPKTAVALPAVGPTQAGVVTITFPDGMDGVITEFSVNFVGGGFVNGSGDIIFRLLRNGAPVRNFENMVSEYGTQETPVPIGALRGNSGDTYTIIAIHAAEVTLTGNVLGSLRGYYYPNRGR